MADLRRRTLDWDGVGPLTVFAPAKVNAWLQITGRRADGYHGIDSLFCFAGVGDRLTFTPAEALGLSVTGPEAGALSAEDPSNNLVIRAASALQDFAGVQSGADIHLEKNLPTASGIGGGSADAAATLLGLSALWGLELSDSDLVGLALSLGADVPSALFEGPLWVRGIGEDLAACDIHSPYGMVLANPRDSVSTPAVFKAYRASGQPFSPVQPLPEPVNIDAIRAKSNDLQSAAIKGAPVIQTCLDALSQTPKARLVRMSGSGATCFALYNSADEASSAAESMRHARPHWWIWGGDIMAYPRPV